ncbi:MAG TPA: Ig-like domain-containing protein [Candidatus Acidoferrum sp.]|nr:Ig-like domain-containing protein [Candidatus Acidoferrum sp.]
MHTRPTVVTLAALFFLLASGAGVAEAQVNLTGDWRLLPQTVPINPIHVALLHTGRVLVVSGSENDPTVTTYRAAVWDPASGAFAVQDIPWDLFCNAMTFLPDGRVLTTGGNLQYNPFRGIRTTTVFDPATQQFSQLQDMARGRWYPSNLALADGRTLTFSGWLETGGTNNAVELYTVPGGWSPELFAPFTPPLYPWLHLLPDGRVFDAGAQVSSHVFNPATQTWTTNVAATLYPNERTYGSSVLLPLRPGEGYRARIMIMGGDNPATDTAEIIDFSQPTPAWRALPSMSAPRIQMNAVLLPTGKVLALGGSVQNNTASTASLGADLFDPDTETWTRAGTMARPRMYHSVALLMPDATVLVAGSNPEQGTWDDTMEAYRPPYLFTASGALASRPTITAAPTAVGYNATFPVTTPNPTDIASVALMRPGSSTHAFNFEQRLVNLAFTPGTGTTLTLTSPPNANVAPPGYYMLFLINRAGVPSVAAWVQLTTQPGNLPPRGTITTPSGDVTIRAGQSVSFAGSGTDPNGTVTGFAWSFPGGTPASSTSATPGSVTYSTPGTYDAMLVVTDNGGLTDPSPPRRRITVLPATITAGFTAPAAGATVAGTQPVNMTVTNAGGSSNTFTLTIDGTQVFTTTTASATASFSWNTVTYTDGAHTLGLTVRDATGATATTTRAVSVNNAAPGNEISVSFPNLSPGQTVRGQTSVRIAAAGTSGANNRFSISVDGVGQDVVLTNATAIDWPWNTTGLTNGSHTLSASVTDATGRSGTGTEYVTVMNTLSVFITSPAVNATVTGTTWVDVWVEGVSGTSNVFTLSVGGVVVASATDSGRHVTLPWDTTRTPNGPRTLAAQVRDAANNGGQDTRPVIVQNGSSGPAASFTSPAAGATVTGTVGVGLAASGGSAPYTYRLTIDGTQVFTTTTSATSATYTWNTTTATNGNHTLGLTVTDATAASATASRAVTVSNGTALAASFSSPAAGATVNGTVSVGLAASGGTAPYTYRLTIDGTQVFTTTTSAGSAAYTWNTTTASNGGHSLGLTVTDSAGASATATRAVTVSNTSGTLRISLTTPAAGSTVSGTVWVNVWVDGAAAGTNAYTMTVGSATIWTESSTATHVTLPWTTTSTPNGQQTLVVNVRDASGNTGTGNVTVTVQNGTSPLAAGFSSPAAGATVAGTVGVGLTASGGSQPYTYRLTVDGTQVFATTVSAASASFNWNTTTVGNGNHTLGLTVTDAGGASATASRTVTVSNGGTPLSASFTSPAAGATVTGSVSVGLAAAGGTPAYTYRLSVDSTPVFSSTTSAASTSYAWNTTTAANGAHTLSLTVTDTAGGSATTTRSVTVSNTAGGTVQVFLTSPDAGATVSGTVWVNIWVEGAAAGTNAYTMTVGGTTVWSESSTGTHVSLPWVTTNTPNGARTLVVTVGDSTGATGTASVAVTVQNP